MTTHVQIVHKNIRLRSQHPREAEKISKEFKVSSVAARILAARGYKADTELKNFLAPTLKEGLPDPRDLKNLNSACALVAETIVQKKPIAICCDFDVDGLSGGSQIHSFFQALRIPSKVFVPDRFEDGYGLNEKMIESIATQGFGLVITVDYGTTNLKELDLARKLDLKTIVIDHHHVGAHAPCCDVFINPQQSGCGFANQVLSAAGLAWYFVVGLKNSLPGGSRIDTRAYLDLACLGTICDMVPLVGANRIIAKRGLELLSSTKRPGLIALKEVVGVNGSVGCYDVSFGIGPRLNAAGRIVHGEMVIDLLTTSEQAVAHSLAHKLNRLNLERQDIESQVKDGAVKRLRELYTSSGFPAALVVWDESFHTGVIGIVAQRLVESFYRPAIVMGLDSDQIFKGSVRGIKGFSVVEALSAVSPCLLKYGGHEGAGGFSVERNRVEEFAEAFIAESERRLRKVETSPYAEADTEVHLTDVSFDLVQELKGFAPFGMGNPSPQVLVKGLSVVELRELKSAHLKATLTDGKSYISGLLWRHTAHPELFKGAKVNVVFRPDVSTFRGERELQANLQAIERA